MSGVKIPLKIILGDLGPSEEELTFSTDGGVRVGSIFVSPQGISASAGSPSYVLSPDNLIMLSDQEGGFLGKGISGVVRQAVDKRNGAHIALKEIQLTSQTHWTEIEREIETLYDPSAQASPHMVEFYGAYTHEGSVYIGVECMDGTLSDLPKPMPLDILAHMVRSVLRGLMYLHRTRHLMHRDLKPSNVLFKCRTGDVKISDFGVASNLECTTGDAHSFVGTLAYMSPERLLGKTYSYAADIWSLGLVVAELALGASPFAGLRGDSTEGRFWSLVQHLQGDGPALRLPPTVDPDLADFITACVAKEPEDRPTCTALLQHPFIAARCGAGDAADADQADRAVVRRWLLELCDTARARNRAAPRNAPGHGHCRGQVGEPAQSGPATETPRRPYSGRTGPACPVAAHAGPSVAGSCVSTGPEAAAVSDAGSGATNGHRPPAADEDAGSDRGLLRGSPREDPEACVNLDAELEKLLL